MSEVKSQLQLAADRCREAQVNLDKAQEEFDEAKAVLQMRQAILFDSQDAVDAAVKEMRRICDDVYAR